MPLLLRLLVCSVALTTLNGTCTPLHKAALNGDLNTLKSLIQSGTSINATNEKGMTALHLAAYNGQKDMVKFLLDSGAAFHQKDEYWGMTSLVLAALYEQTEVVEIFLQGGKFTQEGCQAVLGWGGHHGNQKMLAAALTAGASINWQDQFGFTALHLASGEGHKEVIVFLLEQGADINTQNSYKRTPLHRAAVEGHKEVVVVLAEAGANMSLQDKGGKTPLQYAQDNLWPDMEDKKRLEETIAYLLSKAH